MVAFTVYQTSTRLYVVRHESRGGEDGGECWRVLKLDRCSPVVEAAEDPHTYSRPQIQRLLASIHAGAAGGWGACGSRACRLLQPACWRPGQRYPPSAQAPAPPAPFN